jgi:propionyl-CoA carboxylase beta chain
MGAEGASHSLSPRAQRSTGQRVRTHRKDLLTSRTSLQTHTVAAERGFVDEVIEPAQTQTKTNPRSILLENKRDTNPPRKHGNIPLAHLNPCCLIRVICYSGLEGDES